MGVAIGAVMLNLYLLVRREFVVRGSESPASLAAGVAAAGGWALLEGVDIVQWLRLLATFTILDLVVIPIVLGIPAVYFVRLLRGPTEKQGPEK